MTTVRTMVERCVAQEAGALVEAGKSAGHRQHSRAAAVETQIAPFVHHAGGFGSLTSGALVQALLVST